MSSSPIQGQWALDSTAHGNLSVLTGPLRAATHDNIQVFPLLVCEQFGNTLPMSTQTIQKIETVLLQTPAPAVPAFMEASIGFSRNDCATQLGESMGGQRFLGLAAALVTTVGSFHGAKALVIMMEASKVDENQKSFVPSTRHLSDILERLAARSFHCGFYEIVATWEAVLREKVLPTITSKSRQNPGNNSGHRDQFKLLLTGAPTPETIAAIVDCLRQVARMGKGSIIGVTITIGPGVAWVLAFAQWCLDIPPSLSIDDTNILDPPGSLVKVVIPVLVSNTPIEIKIHHKLELHSQLLQPATRPFMYRMLPIKPYGQWLLREFGFDSKTGRRLLNQILEYSIPQILPRVRCGKFARLGRLSNFVANYTVDDRLDLQRLTLLPDIRTISYICSQIQGQSELQQFTVLDEGTLIQHLPLVQRHLGLVQKQCRCDSCHSRTMELEETVEHRSSCEVSNFFSSISTIIMNIFALSLFESPTGVLVRASHDQPRGLDLKRQIHQLLWTGESQEFDDMRFLDWARGLTGHDFLTDEQWEGKNLIITSSKGQVMYPALYESYQLENHGYFRLFCFPGVLEYDGDIYDMVTSKLSPSPTASEASESSQGSTPSDEVMDEVSNQAFSALSPQNLYSHVRVSWRINTVDNHEIEAELMIQEGQNDILATANPEHVLMSLKDALIYESCAHDSQRQIEEADHFAIVQPPWYDTIVANNSNFITIIPVDGASYLRYFAVASVESTILMRKHACLRCCLDICRDNNVQTLIL